VRTAEGPTSRDGAYAVEARVVASHVPALDLFAGLYRHDPGAFWLDSGGEGRFSILGSADGVRAHTVRYRNGEGHVTVGFAGGRVEERPGDVFRFLAQSLASHAVAVPPGLPCPFALGYVGYLGYELRGRTMGMRVAHPSEHDDAHLVFAERAVVVDHRTGDVHALALVRHGDDELTAASRAWLDDLPGRIAALGAAAAGPAPAPALELAQIPSRFEPRHDHDEYVALVRECLEQIRRGESYELCLTNEFRTDRAVDPWDAYLRLRALSPVPYGAYLSCGSVSVLSASPEGFLRVGVDGVVESRPIKGTRPRGETAADDERLREDLRTSVKDRAENLMIVDLLRNDLSTVCEVGSVEVPGLFEIETFPLVHQLVSTVRGRLRADRSAVDCTVAAFPGGSMTGAPKRRSLEILERLEGGPRGIYSGALGWFSLSGAAELSIVIRTIVVAPGGTTFGVGGAVTALSDPQDEYVETLVKARAMATALAAAGTPPAAD
jgi:para-aminobenzoate synthetase